MKHNLLLTLGLAAMAFAGCTHDFDEPTPVVPAPAPEGTIAINIDGFPTTTSITRMMTQR